MKTFFLSLILCVCAGAATLNVCNSGCTYSTVQAAASASNPGDTILLQAGQNFGALTMPGGWHNITVKSSAIDAYPRNQRITRSNPALARITQITLGDSQLWLNATIGTNILTNEPGASPTPHGLTVGQEVVAGGTHYSGYVCASVNQAPYTDGACTSDRVGYINVRQNTNFANGEIIYLIGRSAPSPLSLNTPYYVMNFSAGSSWPLNADKFQISATAGGPPITIPEFNPTGQDFIITVNPLPVMIGTPLYVTSTPTASTLTLSLTPGGVPVTWAQIPFNYNGGFLSSGFNGFTVNPVHDITFDGIEVLPASDAGIYYPFLLTSAIGNFAGEHYNISILRSWIHGAPDQQDFPFTTINIAANNIEIGWSVVEDAYSTGNDTQGIGFMATHNVYIHDNEIKGAAEGIMSGGNIPWFVFQTNTTGVRVIRNYIWKPISYFNGIAPTYISGTQFTLLSRYNGTDCSTVATVALQPQLGQQCFGYESQETPGTNTSPAASVIVRDMWTATAAASIFTVSGSVSGQEGFLYWLGGAMHMDYNFSGTVSCPSGVICTYLASPVFPPLSSRIGLEIIGAGNAFDGSFYIQNRNVFAKNLIESKYGDNWLIEGNVFHRVINIDNGETTQYMGINMTSGITGSGNGDPANYLATSSNSIIRHNLFRMMPNGVVGVGKSFAVNIGATGLIWEWAGFGGSSNNLIQNNAFMDLGSTEYTAYFGGAILHSESTTGYTVDHNTVLDARIGLLIDGQPSTIAPNSQTQGITFTSNIITPYRSSCSTGGCANPATTTEIGVQDQPGAGPYPYIGSTDGANSWVGALANLDMNSGSSLINNILMNRAGFEYVTGRPTSYPTGTYLIEPTDTGADPNVLFTSWQERNNAQPPNGIPYRMGNYHLAAGQSALYPSADARVIGADIDEITSFVGGIEPAGITGQNNMTGIDVENGAPQFYQRVARNIAIGGTSAVLTYLSNGFTCTIQLWPNTSYSGTPVISINDSGAQVISGITTVLLAGLTANTAYQGKRLCGPEADIVVFTTLAGTPALTYQFAPPAGTSTCVIEYGSTRALGSSSAPVGVNGGICSVSIPSTGYWRNDYRNIAGNVTAMGDIRLVSP